MTSRNTLKKAVLAGWALAPFFVAQTGAPFSLYDCTYAINACPYAMFTGAEPSTPVNPLKATPTPNQYVYLDFARSVDSSWFNPALGTSDWGPYPHNMSGRNFFRAPGSFNLNLGINKNFTFGESRRLQFRGELFNFFNHPNLEANIADNDVSSSRRPTTGGASSNSASGWTSNMERPCQALF